MSASLRDAAHLVDGVDLADASTYLTHDGAGLWSGLTETISVSTAAGVNGGTVAGGVFVPYVYPTMYAAKAASSDAAWALIRALRRRCKPGRTVTLTRLVPDPEGTDANVTQTTTARRQGDRPEWLEANNRVNLDIDWLITGGPWLGDAVAIGAVGAVTVKGDLPTRLITVTLAAGGVNPVLTNTNGYTLRYIGTVPAGGVTVDVANRRATGITGSVDLSANLRWSKDAPFQLDPDAQTLAISSGSASFTYYPAYQ